MITNAVKHAIEQYNQANSWNTQLSTSQRAVNSLKSLFATHHMTEIATEGIPYLPDAVYDKLPKYIKENLYFVRDVGKYNYKKKNQFYRILIGKLKGTLNTIERRKAEKKYDCGTAKLGSIAVQK